MAVRCMPCGGTCARLAAACLSACLHLLGCAARKCPHLPIHPQLGSAPGAAVGLQGVCEGPAGGCAWSPAQRVLFVQLVRQRVHVGLGGHRLVEGSVKYSHLDMRGGVRAAETCFSAAPCCPLVPWWSSARPPLTCPGAGSARLRHSREDLLCCGDALEVGRVVQRRQVAGLAHNANHAVAAGRGKGGAVSRAAAQLWCQLDTRVSMPCTRTGGKKKEEAPHRLHPQNGMRTPARRSRPHLMSTGSLICSPCTTRCPTV